MFKYTNLFLILFVITSSLSNAEDLTDIQISAPSEANSIVNNEAISDVKTRNIVDGGDLLQSINGVNVIRRGGHAREDFPKRDDENYMKHTLSWYNGKEVKINYRPVNLSTLTNDVQTFPPKERVY